jgi:DNA-directed RNA polymerase omega subunit
MGFIPIEELCAGVENKYMAVLVAAKESRRLNEMRRAGKIDVTIKPITLALERLKASKVVYQHDV